MSRVLLFLLALCLVLSPAAAARTKSVPKKSAPTNTSLPPESLEALAEGVGAEDYNLYVLRDYNRRDFYTLFYAIKASPHVAAILQPFVLPDFDSIMFGNDEVHKKSPMSQVGEFLSSVLVLLAPGVTIAIYAFSFFDTNPVEVILLMTSFVILDVQFWWQLYMIARIPKLRGSVFRNIVYRTLWALIGTAFYRYIAFPVLPWYVVDALFYGFIFVAPFLSIYRLYEGISMANLAIRVGKGSRRAVVNPERVEDVQAALSAADAAAEGLFQKRDPALDYEGLAEKDYLGTPGSFGEVFRATDKKTGEKVAIKKFKSEGSGPQGVARLLRAATSPDGVQEFIGTLSQVINESFTNVKSKNAKHERRALTAAKAICGERFCNIIAAYETTPKDSTDPDYYIVMRAETAGWKKTVSALPLSGRVAFFTRFAEAIAALHAGGIQHRDLKEGNIAIRAVAPATVSSPSSSSAAAVPARSSGAAAAPTSSSSISKDGDAGAPVPVIIDFGTALLPDSVEDGFIGVGTAGYRPPEAYTIIKAKFAGNSTSQTLATIASGIQLALNTGSLGIAHNDFESLSSGGMGYPSDVFAAAVIGITIFSGVSEPSSAYYEAVFQGSEFLASKYWSTQHAAALARRAIPEGATLKECPSPAILSILADMLHPLPELRPTMDTVVRRLQALTPQQLHED